MNDSTIILRLGGDKGGSTMAFKFGATVMNCLQPNLPENFDLIATMEAFDTYQNLKTAIFQYFDVELRWICETAHETAPTIIVILIGSDPLLVESFSGTIEPPSTTSTIL